MSLVYNPKIREAKLIDKLATPSVRSYLRLRELQAGESSVLLMDLRRIFGVNGEATHVRINEQLRELRESRMLTYQRFDLGGRVAYRIVLEVLPEELPENALVVPKSIKADLTTEERVATLFMRLEDDKLGIMTSFTVKDWQNCRRLLKDNSVSVVKGAVKRFWAQKAEYRKNPNFTEFYFDFARLANDAVDELQVQAVIKADKARKERPAQTHRQWLLQEIKANRKFPDIAARFQKELDELDEEED